MDANAEMKTFNLVVVGKEQDWTENPDLNSNWTNEEMRCRWGEGWRTQEKSWLADEANTGQVWRRTWTHEGNRATENQNPENKLNATFTNPSKTN